MYTSLFRHVTVFGVITFVIGSFQRSIRLVGGGVKDIAVSRDLYNIFIV